jgi:hypothetical protein
MLTLARVLLHEQRSLQSPLPGGVELAIRVKLNIMTFTQTA